MIIACFTDAKYALARAATASMACERLACRTATTKSAPSALDDSSNEAPDEAPGGAGPDTTGFTVNVDGTEVSYLGREGLTALDYLLQLDPSAFADGEGANAFVTTIGGRAADDAKHEFWAFYVNGEQAQVGAGSYVMKDGDVITWKLETY
jgi:hypothetical protein